MIPFKENFSWGLNDYEQYVFIWDSGTVKSVYHEYLFFFCTTRYPPAQLILWAICLTFSPSSFIFPEGSGRSSLAKIASWLCKYSIFTVDLSKTYGTSEFKEDLKLVYSETGVKNRPTSFVFDDTQIVDESFLKIVSDILSTGEVTGLYRENEFDEVILFFNYLVESVCTSTANG